MALKGRRFDTRESIIADSKKVLKNIPKYAFSKCFKSWEKRWKLCIDLSLSQQYDPEMESGAAAATPPKSSATTDLAVIPPKDFQCPVCHKFFSRKFTLEMHLLIHQGLKPHTCPYCGKSFRQKGTLMRHKELHSRKSLFHCSLCNKSFHLKNVFLHHVKVRHEVAPGKMEWRKEVDTPENSQPPLSILPNFSAASQVGENFSPPIRGERNNLGMKSSGGEVKEKSSVIHHRAEFLPPPPLSGPQGRPQNNHLPALPQLTMSPFAAAAAKAPVKWHCNICLFETPFDYTICNSHLMIHEHQFHHKCFLCLKLFASSAEYNQHIEQFHGDNKSLSEDILAYTSSTPGPKFTKEALPDKKSAPLPLSEKLNLPTVNSGELTIKPISAPPVSSASGDSNPAPSSTGLTPEKHHTTLTCIPCQIDFASEEDFECHVKTHVQSVLVVDSDSEGSYDTMKMHSSRPQDSEILSHALNGNISIENKMGQPIVLDTRIPSLLSGGVLIKQDQYKMNKDLLGYKENFNRRSSFGSFKDTLQAAKRARTHQGGYSFYDAVTAPMKNIPNNFITSDSLLKLEKLKQNISSKFGQEQAKELSSGLLQPAGQNLPTSKPPSPTQVFLCPFCKKYFSSAKILCRHAKRHLQQHQHYPQPKKEEKASPNSSVQKLNSEVEIIKVNGEDVEMMEQALKPEDVKSEGEVSDEEMYETKPNVDSVYDYDAPLVCEECNLEFRKKCLYAYHLQLHTKVKAYSCWICHRRFREKSLLLRHTLALHMKSFTCPHCTRQFRYKSLFKYHLTHCSTAASDPSSLCVPIIDLKQMLGAAANIVGVIPIGSAKQALGIPVISPAHLSALSSLPLMGKIPIFGKVELTS
ncbi:hypothetical protein LAZ67_15002427 [Cordylochernes scorpioides]|uniref:C2H2-type domain-containing protein n=1 Tax=Cordylochernes scorpioides TaxID=51811 RepID=A0ABY6L9J7_9ARAC|nr:hypothetical protein LAZ67_15002427 [Cordylochernes scorpioides]